MTALFHMDNRDLKKLQRFMAEAPREFKRASAGVLNSLAFSTRKYDIENINRGMTVRSPKFVNAMLRVDKTRSTEISKQVAYAYSVKRKGFSGWEEQQTGKPQERERAATTPARGGNIRSKVLPRNRMKPGNKFYRPSQFKRGKGDGFGFMMRVMATRGGGNFYLSQARGKLRAGLWSFRQRKLSRLQATDDIKEPKRFTWRTYSLNTLTTTNDIKKIWSRELDYAVKRAR
jgi:hypothetical protein